MKQLASGLFISFEGPECAGKSTQTKRLKAYLSEKGYNVVLTREPGGTHIGEELRNLVKHVVGEDAPCTEAELLMFAASRAQLVNKLIAPTLNDGGIVICDRFADSTTAYQGYARNYDLQRIYQLHDISVDKYWPDITFLLDLDAEVSRQRHAAREETKGVQDRFEDEALSFHKRVREGFLELAELNPDRFYKIDANQSIETIELAIKEKVDHVIEQL